jgi:uncharacterized protein (UPF0248 family)
MTTVRELLNRLRWDPGAGRARVLLKIRVRVGGEERLHDVRFEDVAEILPGGVNLADGTFLPYHRIVDVRRGDEALWRSIAG